MSKYTQEELATKAAIVIEDLENGNGQKGALLLHVMEVATGLPRDKILAKLHGLTVGIPA